MTPRERGFLDPKKLPEEVFDYVRELHDLLWRVVRIVRPGASGDVGDMVEDAIGVLEATYAAQSEADGERLKQALAEIALSPDESDEWDAMDKYRDVRELA